MDYVKEAFDRVKKDIYFLSNEIEVLKSALLKTAEKVDKINDLLEKNDFLLHQNLSTQDLQKKAILQDISTDKTHFRPLKPGNQSISIGNEGVSTDRQTDRQTNEHKKSTNQIDTILESLDEIKKETRLKFKRLTEQEFLVFSAIYQLEEESGFSDYKSLAKKLNLTESSIRDYVCRIVKKDIPLEKIKVNNKSVRLKISSSLRKITSLPTILQLREL